MQGTPDEIRRRYNLEEEKVSGSNFSLPEFISIDEPNEILGVDGTLEINGDVYINSKLVKAWVVDSGTTDGWHWKKYTDGTWEAWTMKSYTPASSTQGGNMWYSDTKYCDLPFATTDAISHGMTNYSFCYTLMHGYDNQNNRISFRICRNAGAVPTSSMSVRLWANGTY